MWQLSSVKRGLCTTHSLEADLKSKQSLFLNGWEGGECAREETSYLTTDETLCSSFQKDQLSFREQNALKNRAVG